MKPFWKLGAALVMILGLTTCTAFAGNEDVAEGWNRIRDGALLIDVRTAQEFEAGHLDGAINIPFDQVDALAEAIGDDKGRSVVLYCRSGRRSGIATEALTRRGYAKVFNAGGFKALLAARPDSSSTGGNRSSEAGGISPSLGG